VSGAAKGEAHFHRAFQDANHGRGEVMNGIESDFPASRRNLPITSDRRCFRCKSSRRGQGDELASSIERDTRICDERQKTIGYVCEVPVLIGQRLFGLARAIQQSLE
jgi:hypothetical protein